MEFCLRNLWRGFRGRGGGANAPLIFGHISIFFKCQTPAPGGPAENFAIARPLLKIPGSAPKNIFEKPRR